MQLPRNLEADDKASRVIDFIESSSSTAAPMKDEGVFKHENWVVLYGGYDEKYAEFEQLAIFWGYAQAWYYGLKMGRSHGIYHWAIVIESRGCVTKMLKDAKKFWKEKLKMYDDWLATLDGSDLPVF